ncbi:DUF4450 domain-containing protein [Formosa sp. S-31]|uniref:DUF4450 domain-containing protein n=1 Tax=Formosa sp. S-31 TaxID=2790949 RepID=UPI003EBA9611
MFRNIVFKSLFIFWIFSCCQLSAQNHPGVWHDTIRSLHYKPDGDSFVLVKGTRKFNRAIYGTNTGFRLETGDLPEFAMYLPGMGGNFKLGFARGDKSKWITAADSISTRYLPGTMVYEIRDALLKEGFITVQVVAYADREGFLAKLTTKNIPENIDLYWAFGGASGKKFHRDGDIGADPESVFYLQSDYCINNSYTVRDSSFKLDFGSENNKAKTGNNRHIVGCFPPSEVKMTSAEHQESPSDLFASKADTLPVISGKSALKLETSLYWSFQNNGAVLDQGQDVLKLDFEKGVEKMKVLRSRVKLKTPDPYINALGGALAVAADAIYEDPAYLHGAVAWRMHLNAWRGAYVADPLGWKDRAESHFISYGKSQVLQPETGPVVLDSSRNFARQKEVLGTAMFSKGYISRRPENNTIAHHYDMNSVFINQLLRHYLWTGDQQFIKELWPVVKRHLEWEKRNFDVDGDGLYDAYACIWASDALQYSGGGVTYASAYNYSANKIAAKIAEIIGENPAPYIKEAKLIKKSVQEQLWVSDKGVFAEYKDALGNRLLHDYPGLWTVYHTLDEDLADAFQAYQMLDYVDREIPHIPVVTDQPEHKNMFLLSTTNWHPYTWSVNNVALAENLHGALGYWQGGKPEKGFQIWRNALIESMYYGASPGGFQQLSFYDAIRGELYRDFADPIGMAARSLVEGLFGVRPDATEKALTIIPGFPDDWDFAELDIPDMEYKYSKSGDVTAFQFKPKFDTKFNLKLIIKAEATSIKSITVNDKPLSWKVDTTAIGHPKIILEHPYHSYYDIKIVWAGMPLEKITDSITVFPESPFVFNMSKARIIDVHDPQRVLKHMDFNAEELKGEVNKLGGDKTMFVQLQQDEMQWWQPMNIRIKSKYEIVQIDEKKESFDLLIKKDEMSRVKAVKLNGNTMEFKVSVSNTNMYLKMPQANCVPGTNQVEVLTEDDSFKLTFQNWNLKLRPQESQDVLDIQTYFNAKVTDVFQQQYLSPRPTSPTLQLPTQGIGNWCYPYIQPVIDDTGLRTKAALGTIKSLQDIPFNLLAGQSNNIAFTSMWDNYPESIKIPLSGNASHAYFLMAGTTNPMQTRMTNGVVNVVYTDDTSETLELKNPENWWPIEQNYYTDGFAFTTGAVKPPRLYLKSGEFIDNFKDFKPIKGFSDFGVDGGAATLLDLPLDETKILKHLEVKTLANDVVIGLMGVTLIRN